LDQFDDQLVPCTVGLDGNWRESVHSLQFGILCDFIGRPTTDSRLPTTTTIIIITTANLEATVSQRLLLTSVAVSQKQTKKAETLVAEKC